MPQAAWTASRLRSKDSIEQTPSASTVDAMQMVSTEGRVTRSQSRIREKYAPFSNGTTYSEMKELRNSSHASISLLTPRVRSSHFQKENQPVKDTSLIGLRRTSLVAIEQAKASSPMDIDLVTPKVSNVLNKEVVRAYNFGKENEVRAKNMRRSSSTYVSELKPSTGPELMSVLKSGFTSAVGGMRARQVNEDMERGGGNGFGSRIMVYVRLRPMSRKEKEAGARSCVKVDNKRDVYLTEMALETDYLRLKRLRGRHFAFDAAFPDNTSQEEVYHTSTANLVQGVLDGKNASVFCYGATGAGKTHTMLGTVQHPGVMVLALKDLFVKLKQRSPDGEHVVRLSYLEVYNESVRDLLSPGRPLVLREDTKLGIVAAGLTQFQACTADEIMTLLHKGNTNRQTEPTRVNETSSRSHAILQVVVEYKVHQATTGKVLRTGKLSLIDLAGSERALATDQRTLRSVEGANINRSLLALSSCINALVEGKKHIPFRNSKLTQLLKDSLGGECQTAMIANVSPSNITFSETQNTLHWADRAKEIRTKECEAQEELQVPESHDEQAKLLLQMQKENQLLKLHLARLEQKYLLTNGVNMQSVSAATPCTPMVSSAIRTYPGEPLPQVETLARRGEAKTLADKKIWELQRTVELLEMEAEKTRRDSALREEKMNASILALTRDHTTQLKRKDEYIRNLCESMNVDTPLQSAKVVASPIKALENILKQRADSSTQAKLETAEKPRRYVTPNMSRKAFPLPPASSRSVLPKEERSPVRMTRRTTRSQTPRSPAKTPTKTPKCVPRCEDEDFASCRKRTFWDITNSPNSHLGRSSRASVGGTSQLRQPGFARRRTSPEQD